ncbi:hypothetical protein EGH24_13570 [Halonotius terrestris]|uniref:PD-(D/E)XK nuclease superfamily protein n=1 Tax=Halonotius terrestris TaxID=2487750 RepID=A0A8J8PAR1_9EURY|nr:PD-(D/E)XK nuclease family protein [Halonotius terrestris]TQQ78645.1 hypothetical protein EGH24_13570 [Halonotius terrestris]
MDAGELTEGEIDEILSLYRQATTEQTTTFDIIDRAGDERTHTKFLRWMCDPEGSHGLDSTFLNHCLDVAAETQSAIEEVDGSAINSVSAFSRKPDETELDILIEMDTRMIALEIKTQSSLRHGQIDAQTRYLQKQVEKDAIHSWDYILLTQKHQNTKGSYPHLYWSDIHSVLASLVGQVESDIDALRLRDWMRAIDKDLLDQRDFGPDSRLALQYGAKLDQLGFRMIQMRILMTAFSCSNDCVNGYENSMSCLPGRPVSGHHERFSRGLRRARIFTVLASIGGKMQGFASKYWGVINGSNKGQIITPSTATGQRTL